LWAAWGHAWYLRWSSLRPDTFWQDVRHATRVLARRPGFTTAAVLTLALGIGGTTVIFSTLRAVLWRPLPFADPDRLLMVALVDADASSTSPANTASPPDFTDWRHQATSIPKMAAIRDDSFAFTGAGPAEQLVGNAVTEDFFPALGVPAAIGRSLGASDTVAGAPDVAVLSHRLWRRRFGGDPAAVGKRITLDGVSCEIVGVMPASFDFPLGAEVWTPLRFTAADLTTQRGAHYLTVVGRLRPGITLTTADAEVHTIGAALEKQYAKSNARTRVTVLPLRQAVVGDVQPALRLLFAAVGLVFLVACVNVASLVLGSAMARRRDLAVRAALGASRGRLVRSLFVESTVLAVAGGAAGLALAAAGVRAIAAAATTDIALLDGTRIDVVVLGYAAAVTGAAAVLFGAWPAWQASRREGGPELTGAGVRTSSRESSRARNLLVTAEIAMAVALLVGAGLLGRSFAGLMRVPLGFDPGRVETGGVSLPDASYASPDRRTLFADDVIARLMARRDVEAAAATFGLPLTNFGYYINVFDIDGQPPPKGGKQLSVELRTATPRYFEAIGTQIVAGRDFSATDGRGGLPVAIVNERAAKLLWPTGGALGHHVTISTRMGLGGDRLNGDVVGIIGDIHDVGPGVAPRPTVYFAHAQYPVSFLRFVVKPRGDPADLAASLRETIAAVDPNVPIFAARPMRDIVSMTLAQPKFYLQIVGLFAIVAIALAAVGIYGVMAQSVGARRREIGIRLAMGATAGTAVRLILRQAGWLALAGVGIGLGSAAVTTRLMAKLLFGVTPLDLVTFAVVTGLTLAVAAFSAWLPARRAARVDPIATLRGSD
jgi:predicted permease